ncbi:MAG: ATP-binding protein [Oscillatoria sp. SIO1A7]|nr:ATP-binding protein [Oscillatoria sp. SIO1A7]
MAGVLRASEEGLRIVDLARRNPGWNKSSQIWCQAALTSKATLKRFWARKPIRRQTFIDICKAVGIDNWEDIVDRRDIQETEPFLAAAIADLPNQHFTNNCFEGVFSFALPENLPPVRGWVGRQEELAALKALVLDGAFAKDAASPSPYPVTAACIVGLPGIGKTTLVSQLVRELEAEETPFVAVAWQYLSSATGEAPPFEGTIDSLLSALSNGDSGQTPNAQMFWNNPPEPAFKKEASAKEDESQARAMPGIKPGIKPEAIAAIAPEPDYLKKTELLIRLLKAKPCLIVFDRAETVLKTGDAQGAGYFSDRYPEYAWLFKQLLETEHQSKIIFTSRESLADLSPTVAREIALKGLDRDSSVALLQSFNLATGTASLLEELAELAELYRGHPKALELVAALIRQDEEFQGRIDKFLAEKDWLLIRELETLIDETCDRLSEIERTCLSRISVYQPSAYPLSCAGIAAQMPEVGEYELKESILRALKRRQLLSYDTERRSFQLHPLVREKAQLLLHRHPEKARTAHRQAYSYFSDRAKPQTEWKNIEDIEPLLRVRHHACKAEDWDEANRAVSGLSEILQICPPELQTAVRDYLSQVEDICNNLSVRLLTEGEDRG